MKSLQLQKALINTIQFPFKLLSWFIENLIIWGLRLVYVLSGLIALAFLVSSVWLGFFIHKNIDRPMSYTPVPAAQQPPEGLTFRQFYQGVKGYYDHQFEEHKSTFVREYGFFLTISSSLPFSVAQFPRDAWVLTHPTSSLKKFISAKDYARFVKPLENQFEKGIKDFPEALWLQIEASYWYWDHEHFLSYFRTHPELITADEIL